MLRAALLDVSGTLWPRQVAPACWHRPCFDPLGRALPLADPNAALAVIRRHLREHDALLEWSAADVAASLDTSVAAVNSALQRAPSTLERQRALRQLHSAAD
jgi:hypothetical protein